jgi:hypothetical protein
MVCTRFVSLGYLTTFLGRLKLLSRWGAGGDDASAEELEAAAKWLIDRTNVLLQASAHACIIIFRRSTGLVDIQKC